MRTCNNGASLGVSVSPIMDLPVKEVSKATVAQTSPRSPHSRLGSPAAIDKQRGWEDIEGSTYEEQWHNERRKHQIPVNTAPTPIKTVSACSQNCLKCCRAKAVVCVHASAIHILMPALCLAHIRLGYAVSRGLSISMHMVEVVEFSTEVSVAAKQSKAQEQQCLERKLRGQSLGLAR